jgi:hypothetical protein
VLVSVAIALDFPQAGAIVGGGLVGGALAALVVILYRRRTGALPSSSSGPSARTMLVEAPSVIARDAPDTPRAIDGEHRGRMAPGDPLTRHA